MGTFYSAKNALVKMSAATKRKHVTRDVLEDFTLPQEDEIIVKVVAGRGNNLHEVKDHQGESFLVSMPQKFRKNVWIKRGDFVVVKPIEEGDKVKAEIVTILYKEQIKNIKSENLWPPGFQDQNMEDENVEAAESFGEDSDDERDLFQNTNRPTYEESESEEETDSDDDK